MESLKRIFDKFCMAITIVTAISIILCGKIATEEQGEKVLKGTEYKSVMLQNNESTVTVQVDEQSINFSKDILKELEKYEKYLFFTPFGYCKACFQKLRTSMENRS